MYDRALAENVACRLFGFQGIKFHNRLSSKSQIFRNCEQFDGSNMSGIFKVIYSKKTYLYICEQGTQVSYPTVGPEFVKAANKLKLVTSFCSGHSNSVPTAETAEAINSHRAKKHSRPTNHYSDLVESPRTNKHGVKSTLTPKASAITCK